MREVKERKKRQTDTNAPAHIHTKHTHTHARIHIHTKHRHIHTRTPHGPHTLQPERHESAQVGRRLSPVREREKKREKERQKEREKEGMEVPPPPPLLSNST